MSDGQRNLETLFLAALEIDAPEERAAFLAESCGDDLTLRKEVEQLLRSHDQAKSFLERPSPELLAKIRQGKPGKERAASLDAGLAAAFPANAAVVMGHANHSVLKVLSKTIDLTRVMLREADTEGREPIVRATSPEIPDRNSDSRYQVQGEIARGGMGAILKGRDTDLGRDLAIKVLLDEHKDKPEVIQRFVEEAQIGGQLQHPGIAPVYELGQFADRRPFFSMKLVKGETLSRLMADRAEPSADRGRFLGIFEKVCETMAYAHSRGVIHRDLKPANIMVGAFGEVQVVDWGLAKVLTTGGIADEKQAQQRQQGQSIIQTRRSSAGSDAPGSLGSYGSQTQMGSVMGTPAYMPPEQALGEIDNLDERADVFGLGAILCEILTGKPPYVGEDGTAVFRLASRGKLDDCMARLDACGADSDLIALTKHCLELELNDRPRNARVLAERVSGYLQSVEDKLRETELAKVDAQVRAEEFRRRQKLALATGTSVAASLVIGLAVSVWQAVRAEREATRARSAEQQAVVVLDELRATAPAFAEQARALAAKEQFAEAIEKLDYAVKLRPDSVEFLVAKGDLLQCQLKLAEAVAVYREALSLQPGLARAEDSVTLCDELLAAKPNADGKLTRESLARLHVAMQRQQRPAAELMPVARLLGEERKVLVEYWLARLKDLPVPAENPLEKRLTVREDGRLALDLSGTQVLDLSPLAGAPLAMLDLSKCQELTDLTPLLEIDLIELNISGTSVADLSPLREMQTLEKLSVADSKVTDFGALSNLRLKSLSFQGCSISDLAPIRKMPVEEISLRGTRVADLSPLIGMQIKSIDLTSSPILDFSPLAKLALEKCVLQHNRIADLGVLRGLPLKELTLWGCVDARNYAAITEIKTLELLLLPSEYRGLPDEELAAIESLRDHPKLRQLGSEIMSQMGISGTGSKEVFWKDWDREQTFVRALRANGIKFSLIKLPSGSYSLEISHQPLRDLSILQGAPISRLNLDTTPVADLTPIHDLKLESLKLFSDSIADLSPLRGMPLKTLVLFGSKFSDLSPLKGLPLRELYLDHCKNVLDVSALAEIPTLEKVTVPIQAKNIESLRKLSKLRMLSFHRTENHAPDSTAEEFWKDFDWISRLLESAYEPTTLIRLPDGTWDVSFQDTGFHDLAILQGAPISLLGLQNTAVDDLTPLRGMPLRTLRLDGTNVTDLSPLDGMRLEVLYLERVKVNDISVLRGMPLTDLRCYGCDQLTDISALAESKELRYLALPPNAKNIEFLRTLPNLERIDFKHSGGDGRPDRSPTQFWKDFGQSWALALRNAGMKYTAVKIFEPTPQEMWRVTVHSTEFSDCSVFKGTENIRELRLDGTAVADLGPLRGMPLTKLGLNSTKVTDLGPLQGMPIDEIWLGNTEITDLAALRGMPIQRLELGKKVTNLEPLRGMSLQSLRAFNTQVTDLGPLQGMPIIHLHIAGAKLKDVGALRGMPLTFLRLHGCSEITDISPLADCKTLTDVTLPPNAKNIDFLRAIPNLQLLSFRENSKWQPDKTASAFWKEYDAQAWLRRLRDSAVAIKGVKQFPDSTWELNLSDSTISDLTILSGAPISVLTLNETPVSTLEPLRGMAIKNLGLAATKVTDLSPLKGLPLNVLQLSSTKVSDLSPLRGMSLTSLRLNGCQELTDISALRGAGLSTLTLHYCPKLTDVSPLVDCQTLVNLTLPPNAKDIEFLRALPKIERIGFKEENNNGYRPDMSAAEFWKEYDARKK